VEEGGEVPWHGSDDVMVAVAGGGDGAAAGVGVDMGRGVPWYDSDCMVVKGGGVCCCATRSLGW
jgi:hypothetical protein